MARELGAVVEGDRLPPRRRQAGQQFTHSISNSRRSLPLWTRRHYQPRVSFVQRQHRLSVSPKEHRVRLPMTRTLALFCSLRVLIKRTPVGDVNGRTATAAPPPTTLGLPKRQIVPPRVVFGARNLSIDEPIGTLVRDESLASLKLKPPGHLLRRPAQTKTREYQLTQRGISIQP